MAQRGLKTAVMLAALAGLQFITPAHAQSEKKFKVFLSPTF